ncbi:hypothetical protein [Plantactinospora sonchi]|uniref:DUF3592 domain-containing protein n=1 Tax=Plantactinospora sonchi TaxID=1544735 RepID=A0ABU7RY14_9ACTN
MRPAALLRVGLGGTAVAGVLVAVLGLLLGDPTAGWPRTEVLGPLGVAMLAGAGWWWAATRADPADGPPYGWGWWPARRRIVVNLVLVFGGICVLSLPFAVTGGHPGLAELRRHDPVVQEVNIESMGPVVRRSGGRSGPSWQTEVTVRLNRPDGPGRQVTEEVSFDRDPRRRKTIHVLYAPSRHTAGAVLSADRDRLVDLMDPPRPGWFPWFLLAGAALVLVRAGAAGPPGGWRA